MLQVQYKLDRNGIFSFIQDCQVINGYIFKEKHLICTCLQQTGPLPGQLPAQVLTSATAATSVVCTVHIGTYFKDKYIFGMYLVHIMVRIVWYVFCFVFPFIFGTYGYVQNCTYWYVSRMWYVLVCIGMYTQYEYVPNMHACTYMHILIQ